MQKPRNEGRQQETGVVCYSKEPDSPIIVPGSSKIHNSFLNEIAFSLLSWLLYCNGMFRWWKKTKPLSKKIPFLMHVVHLCKILARYKYSSWGYEDCDMRASLERRLLGRILLCCERDLVTDAIKSRSLLFHQENLHKIANMNVFCSHLLLFWAILWLGSVTVVHKTLLLNGMSVSKGSRKDSFQVLVATRWTARKDFTVVVTKHWSIKL